MNFRTLFHYISYLQYPLMLVALYFAFKPYIEGIEQLKEKPDLIFQCFNSSLIFMGLGISFSSLQDTTKTQHKLAKKVWEDPLKGKIFIFLIYLLILIFLITGLIGYYIAEVGIIKDLSTGCIILGLGMIGFLKAAIEMFENHRKDKNTTSNII